jgi:hypothetical protein
MKHLVTIFAAAILVAASAHGGLAATTSVNLAAVDSGFYVDSGDHVSLNTFVTAGFGGTGCGGSNQEFRNFFVFDLSAASGTIVGARLRIQVPVGNYVSGNATEDLSLFEVSTAIATLTAGGTGLTAIYDDLADGTEYGARTLSVADEGTVIEIPFNNAGLAAINAALGGTWAVGGAVTTLASTPPTCELLWGFANPAVKDLVLDISATDDYKCYKAKDLKNPKFGQIKDPGITLDDQFATDSNVAVTKPFLFCTPSDKNSGGIIDPITHLCCYKVKGQTLSPPAETKITDQFGTLELGIKKPQVLCQPCTEEPIP